MSATQHINVFSKIWINMLHRFLVKQTKFVNIRTSVILVVLSFVSPEDSRLIISSLDAKILFTVVKDCNQWRGEIIVGMAGYDLAFPLKHYNDGRLNGTTYTWKHGATLDKKLWKPKIILNYTNLH